MVLQSQRFRYIDALRGISIIAVVMHHAHPYFAGRTGDKLPTIFEKVLNNGDKGVTLFFLMSAFTLCLSLSNRKETEQKPVRNYFIQRFFRIAPLYYFIIFIILLVHFNSPSVSSTISNLFFLHGFNPYWINSTVPGGWSVGIESIFYLIFPFLFFNITSAYRAINLTLIFMIVSKIAISILFKNSLITDYVLWRVFVYENIVSQLPVFLIGICLFQIQSKPTLNEGRQLYKSYILIATIIIIDLLGGNILKEHYLFAIAFAFLALGLSKFQTPILVNGFTVWIGQLSYSIYLTHLIIANLLIKFNLNHYYSDPVVDTIIRFFIIFSLSILFSYATYHIIERPFQKFGKRLIEKLETKKVGLSLIKVK